MATARSGATHHVATDILNPVSFNPDAGPILYTNTNGKSTVRSAYAEMTKGDLR